MVRRPMKYYMAQYQNLIFLKCLVAFAIPTRCLETKISLEQEVDDVSSLDILTVKKGGEY